MYNEIITYYSKTPVNRWVLSDYTIKYQADSRTCWDDVTVYIKLEDDKIKDWSFVWDTTIITTACSSIFWESILWKSIDEVLTIKYDYIETLIELELTSRRKNAAALWILVTKNALHSYLKDWIKEDFNSISE